MAGIGTRVVGLGNHHTARTEAGTVADINWTMAEHADEAPHIQVTWDSGDTTWICADGVTPEK